jgi:hypothetical protein
MTWIIFSEFCCFHCKEKLVNIMGNCQTPPKFMITLVNMPVKQVTWSLTDRNLMFFFNVSILFIVFIVIYMFFCLTISGRREWFRNVVQVIYHCLMIIISILPGLFLLMIIVTQSSRLTWTTVIIILMALHRRFSVCYLQDIGKRLERTNVDEGLYLTVGFNIYTRNISRNIICNFQSLGLNILNNCQDSERKSSACNDENEICIDAECIPIKSKMMATNCFFF